MPSHPNWNAQQSRTKGGTAMAKKPKKKVKRKGY